jgi:hypothetical protein
VKDGRRFSRPPNPYTPPSDTGGSVNLSDPESRVVKALRGFIQDYNAQTVTNEPLARRGTANRTLASPPLPYMHGHATLVGGATGASAHWAPKRLSVPKSTRKERNLRTSSWYGSIARTRSNAGIPRLLERFRSMTENRGVPGSSPGLAIRMSRPVEKWTTRAG